MLILGIYKFFSNSLGIRFGKLSSDFENFEKSRKNFTVKCVNLWSVNLWETTVGILLLANPIWASHHPRGWWWGGTDLKILTLTKIQNSVWMNSVKNEIGQYAGDRNLVLLTEVWWRRDYVMWRNYEKSFF